MENKKTFNLQMIKRLPLYVNALKKLRATGVEYISTTALVKEMKLETMLVRKDLAGLGIPGRQKLGYKVNELLIAIDGYLGWNRYGEAFLVGAGALGSALLGYKQLEEYGLNIVAAFDVADSKIGKEIHGKTVLHISKLPNLAKRMGIRSAILTVPPESAQVVADMLVMAGIRGIWNFSTKELHLPDQVVCHNENIAGGLAAFSFKLKEMYAQEAKDGKE